MLNIEISADPVIYMYIYTCTYTGDDDVCITCTHKPLQISTSVRSTLRSAVIPIRIATTPMDHTRAYARKDTTIIQIQDTVKVHIYVLDIRTI